jgi:hypothetical protein
MGQRRERDLAAIIEPNLDPAHAVVRLGIDCDKAPELHVLAR